MNNSARKNLFRLIVISMCFVTLVFVVVYCISFSTAYYIDRKSVERSVVIGSLKDSTLVSNSYDSSNASSLTKLTSQDVTKTISQNNSFFRVTLQFVGNTSNATNIANESFFSLISDNDFNLMSNSGYDWSKSVDSTNHLVYFYLTSSDQSALASVSNLTINVFDEDSVSFPTVSLQSDDVIIFKITMVEINGETLNFASSTLAQQINMIDIICE